MSMRRSNQDKHINAERLVGFIGGYLVDQGSITLEQLDRALVYQMEMAMQGQRLNIGQVLQQLGYVNAHDLDRAVKRQQQDVEKHRP